MVLVINGDIFYISIINERENQVKDIRMYRKKQ